MRPVSRGLLFVAVSLATRAPFLDLPFLDLDEAAHLVGSRVLLAGGRLYTDFADNKPPLLYVHYALAQALLGAGLGAVRLFTAGVTLPLTAWALSAFYRHDRRGLVAGLLFLVYSAAFLAHDMHAVHSEILMLMPAAWAATLALGEGRAPSAGRGLCAGLLLGAAALFKHPALLWLPVLALPAVALRRSQPARAAAFLAALVAGSALPIVATWAAFARTGGADDLVYWTLTWNRAYAANPIPAGEALLRFARGPLFFALATLPLGLAAWRGGPRDPERRRVVVLLLAVCLLTAGLGFRFFPHYLVPAYAPLALLAAPAVLEWFRAPRARPARRFLAATLCLLLGFTLANSVLYRATDVYPEARPIYAATAERLRQDPCFADASLFVWGYAPMFYVAAGLRPASRFVVPQASLTGYVAGNTASARGLLDTSAAIDPAHWDLLMNDLQSRPPTYVLDTAPSGLYRWNHQPLRRYPRLEAFVRAGYERIDGPDGVQIHRRRGCGPGA